jgi:riboflavin synthase
VALIPTTLTHTTLGTRAPGDGVNLEVDVVAKYVERLVQGYDGAGNGAGNGTADVATHGTGEQWTVER